LNKNKMTKTVENNNEKCMICGSKSHVEVTDRVREGKYKVLRCTDCEFIFLKNYKDIDYSSNYGSLTLSDNWSKNDAVLKRSKSLKRFNIIVADLINRKKSKDQECNVMELGAGNGASIYGINKICGKINIDCVELNKNDAVFLKNRFNVEVYDNIFQAEKKYDIIYGHHVFEHFTNPRNTLDELSEVARNDCKIYLSLPNFNDFYYNSLNKIEKSKYLEFNFHLAHPYYYTIDTFSKLINTTQWRIDSISTIQDYSIVNYFNWYINGTRSKNIEEGTKVDKNIMPINDSFISFVEENKMGNNLSVILKKIL